MVLGSVHRHRSEHLALLLSAIPRYIKCYRPAVAPPVFPARDVGNSLPFSLISGIIKDASTSLEPTLPDFNDHVWIGLKIAHPVRLQSMLGKEIDAALIADKPDFDGARLSSLPPNSGQMPEASPQIL